MIYAHLHNPIKFNYKSRFSDRRCLVLAFIAAARHIEQQQQLKSSHSVLVVITNLEITRPVSLIVPALYIHTHNVFIYYSRASVFVYIMKMSFVTQSSSSYIESEIVFCFEFHLLPNENKRQIMLVVLLFASLFLFVFI